MQRWFLYTIASIVLLLNTNIDAQQIKFDGELKTLTGKLTVFSYGIHDKSTFQPGLVSAGAVDSGDGNMILDSVMYDSNRVNATLYLHLVDSMKNYSITFFARDSSDPNNIEYLSFMYQPPADLYNPVIDSVSFPQTNVLRCVATENQPWNRVLDHFDTTNLSNIVLDTVIKESPRHWIFLFTIKAQPTDGFLQVFSASGRSYILRLNPNPPNTPRLDLDSAVYEFPRVEVASKEFTTVILRNNGSSDAQVDSVRITGADSASFNVTLADGFTIKQGQANTFKVYFTPQRVGFLLAKITAHYSHGVVPNDNARLVGTGIRHAILSAADVHAHIGIPFSYPVRLTGVANDVKFTSYTATLNFNGTVFAIRSVHSWGAAKAANFPDPDIDFFSQNEVHVSAHGDSLATITNDTIFIVEGMSYLGNEPSTIVTALLSTNNEYLDIAYAPMSVVNEDCGIATLSQIEKVRLAQPSPNPANPSTTISFSIAEESMIDLALYSPLGEKVLQVAHGNYSPGAYSTLLDVSSLASGIYTCQLYTPTTRQVKKLVVLK